jgi:23S rRNA (pseudouridine1915-N3)-methyltransferase
VKIRIVAVGGLKDRALRALLADYVGRIARYCAVEELELKEGPRLAAQLEKATVGASVVALDVAGTSLTSATLARRVERLAMRGKGVIAFLIGGADGLPATIVAQADERWSLSPLTFPHRLARLLLAEQLYRALTILRNEPYDH